MLKQRILTAVLLLPLVLAIVFVAPLWLFDAFVGIVVALLALEFAALCKLAAPGRVVFTLVVLGTYLLALLPWPGRVEFGAGLLAAALATWLLALVWLAVRIVLPDWMKALAGVVILGAAGFALHGMKVLQPDGRWVLLSLLVVWAADVGGYAAGRLFGRHKLAPAISPAKTWEGFAGAVALVMLVAAVSAHLLVPADQHWHWYLLLLGTAVISVAGDLFESLLKRQAAVKDSGKLLPGHGGVLDRLDSLLAVAPVFLFVGMEIGIFGELSAIGR